MNCPKCLTKLERINTNKIFYGNIVVEDIAALKCEKCGETYFGEKAYDSTLKKVQEVRTEIPVPILTKIKMMFL